MGVAVGGLVGVMVGVFVGVSVRVGVEVGVTVGVAVAVGVGVDVGVDVGVGVGVAHRLATDSGILQLKSNIATMLTQSKLRVSHSLLEFGFWSFICPPCERNETNACAR